MAAHGYRSSFDDVLDEVETTADPKDATEVTALTATVDQMLGDRFPEESREHGDLTVKYAGARIEGSIERGMQQRRAAIAYGALSEFVAVVDTILAKAQTALAVAKQQTPPSPPPILKAPGAWMQATAQMGPDPDDPVYQSLREIM